MWSQELYYMPFWVCRSIGNQSAATRTPFAGKMSSRWTQISPKDGELIVSSPSGSFCHIQSDIDKRCTRLLNCSPNESLFSLSSGFILARMGIFCQTCCRRHFHRGLAQSVFPRSWRSLWFRPNGRLRNFICVRSLLIRAYKSICSNQAACLHRSLALKPWWGKG